MSEKVELPSVRDRDLRSILDYHGLAVEIDAGSLLCSSCGDVMTWENIGAILVRGKDLVLFCNLSDCIEAAREDSQC
jgi:hypothetical protein